MRILIVGARGMLGRVVDSTLRARGHKTLCASRSGDHRVDIRDPRSVGKLYREVGRIDAVACTAGSVPFAPFAELSYDSFKLGLADKLLGQVELVRQGVEFVTEGGSFTLIAGVASFEPIRGGAVLSTVNGALDAFARAAATELPNGLRINSVSPSIFTEALDTHESAFPGYNPVPAADVARAYVKAIEGVGTGQTIRVGF